MFLTSKSAQAEAVLITRCSAGWDGGEAWIHPTYPGFPEAYPSRCRLPVQQRERTLRPTVNCPAGLMGEKGHLGPTARNRDRADWRRNQPDPGPTTARLAASPPPRRPGSRGAGNRQPADRPTRDSPPSRRPPQALLSPAADRPHHRGGLALRSRPERRRRRRGKRQEGDGKRQRRCRDASPPAPT